jgi:hypothetical protein
MGLWIIGGGYLGWIRFRVFDLSSFLAPRFQLLARLLVLQNGLTKRCSQTGQDAYGHNKA